MIPNVVKGADMRGLIGYLQSAGKANEHENPHVISGDSFLVAWHGAEQLDRAGANDIADYLDDPRKKYGTEIRSQVMATDPETGKVDHMGFTEASGKAPARWVGIHHGASKAGNDHIHIAASMVREDGTRWDGRYGDYRKAQEGARMLEAKYGLQAVAGREHGLAVRGEKRGEREAATRAGMDNTAPQELAHRVRAAAVTSTSEGEWVRRVRQSGVVIKPYFAKGTTDVVSGYSVALKPADYNSKLVFYGGGRLGKDLSLPRVREGFAEPSLEQASASAAEWQAAAKGKPPVERSGREERPLTSAASERAAEHLAAFNDRLASIPTTDTAAWADAARDVSGALSSWARFDPQNRADLNAAAQQLSRSAQVRRPSLPAHRRAKESAMGVAPIFAQAKTDGKGTVAGAILMRQLMNTAVALRDHHVAQRNLVEAQGIHLSFAITSIVSGRFATGPGRQKAILIFGSLVMGIALLVLGLNPGNAGYPRFAVALIALGVGIGCVMQLLVTVAQQSVTSTQLAVASSLVITVRGLGMASGGAIFGTAASGGAPGMLNAMCGHRRQLRPSCY